MSVLIVFGGLPGTEKTTVAKALAQKVDAVHLRVDTIEQAL
jgi:predicted kinase